MIEVFQESKYVSVHTAQEINNLADDIHVHVSGRVIGENILDKYSYYFVNANGVYLRTKYDNAQPTTLRRGDIVELTGVVQHQTHNGNCYIAIDNILDIRPSKGIKPNNEYFNANQADCIIKAAFDPKHFDFFKNQGVLLQNTRLWLINHRFMEVITPTLLETTYPSKAKDLKTTYAGKELFLKKIQEPRLKSYLISGYERVYEIGKIFRNEGNGKNSQFLPEFTNLDMMLSYISYPGLKDVALDLIGVFANSLNVEMSKIPVVNIAEYVGTVADEEKKSMFKKKFARNFKGFMLAEGYPWKLSPQTKPSEDNPSQSQEFRVFYDGQSFMHGYIFNDDSQILADGETAQISSKLLDDPSLENKFWTGFSKNLEQNIPPSGGIGVGLEKMIQLLTKKDSIQKVLFFTK